MTRLVMFCLFSCLITNCVKEAPFSSPVSVSDKTRFAFIYGYEAQTHAKRDCVLEFKSVENGESFSVKATHDKPAWYIVEVAPGTYRLGSIKCLGIGRVHVTSLETRYRILPGKINFQGEINLVTRQERNKNMFYIGTTAAKNKALLVDLYGSLHERNKAVFISGNTGERITKEMIDSSCDGRCFDVASNGLDARIMDVYEERVQECFSKELVSNFGAVGTLETVFYVKNGAVYKEKDEKKLHTYTGFLKSCVKEKISAIKGNQSSNVRVLFR